MKMRKVISVLLVVAMFLSLTMVSGINAGALTSGDYEYEMYTDDSVIITGYTGGAAEKLTIPSKLGGYAVKAIGESAFENAELYEIVLPDTLEYIGDFAFWNTAISTVKIPKNVSYIGAGAFLSGLFTSFSVDSKNMNFSELNGVLFNKNKTELISYPVAKQGTDYKVASTVKIIREYAFFNAFYLKKVAINDNVEQICDAAFMYTPLTGISIPASCLWVGHYAFASCQDLLYVTVNSNETLLSPFAFDESRWYTEQGRGIIYIGKTAYLFKGDAPEEVTVKDGTVRINGKAFAEQKDLQTINIPASVTEIDLSAFDQCSSLVNIQVDEANPEFASVDGMLYNKDKTELYVCPAGKSGVVTVPDGTEYIEDYSFEHCEKITEVVLPDTLTEIGEAPFYGCTSLEKIAIPGSVKTVGGVMFYGCTNLQDVIVPDGSTLLYHLDFYETRWLSSQPKGVMYLGKSAVGYNFSDPADVIEISFAEGTLAVANFGFVGYENLSSVVLPDSMKNIGDSAFGNCPKLKEITVPASVDEIGQYSFGYALSYDVETGEESVAPVEGFVIKGYTNSAAEQYALDNGFEFVSVGVIELSKLLGDVDMDGKITVKDATNVQKYVAGIDELKEQQKANADFKVDGEINIRDATAIQKFLAGLTY